MGMSYLLYLQQITTGSPFLKASLEVLAKTYNELFRYAVQIFTLLFISIPKNDNLIRIQRLHATHSLKLHVDSLTNFPVGRSGGWALLAFVREPY